MIAMVPKQVFSYLPPALLPKRGALIPDKLSCLSGGGPEKENLSTEKKKRT